MSLLSLPWPSHGFLKTCLLFMIQLKLDTFGVWLSYEDSAHEYDECPYNWHLSEFPYCFHHVRAQWGSAVSEAKSEPARHQFCWRFETGCLSFQTCEHYISIVCELSSLRCFVIAPWIDKDKNDKKMPISICHGKVGWVQFSHWQMLGTMYFTGDILPIIYISPNFCLL